MSRCRLVLGIVAALVAAGLLVSPGFTQQRGDLYRIGRGFPLARRVPRNGACPRARKLVLADLKGPGKITYFYITPVSDLG